MCSTRTMTRTERRDPSQLGDPDDNASSQAKPRSPLIRITAAGWMMAASLYLGKRSVPAANAAETARSSPLCWPRQAVPWTDEAPEAAVFVAGFAEHDGGADAYVVQPGVALEARLIKSRATVEIRHDPIRRQLRELVRRVRRRLRNPLRPGPRGPRSTPRRTGRRPGRRRTEPGR
jgi:hypothetical protein